MRVLALDTACAACSVAVLDGDRLAAARFVPMARGQTEALMPMVGAAMEDAGIGFEALGLIGVTNGPGSFTGLRTGLAAARGLALGCGAGLVGVTTLEAVARRAMLDAEAPPAAVLVALTTGRAELYVQRFDAGGAPMEAPAALLPEEAAVRARSEALLVAGDGAGRLRALLGDTAGIAYAAGPGLPRAEDVARIAAARGADAGGGPQPIYLYPPRAVPAAAGRGVAP